MNREEIRNQLINDLRNLPDNWKLDKDSIEINGG